MRKSNRFLMLLSQGAPMSTAQARRILFVSAFAASLLLPRFISAQASYTAQIRGTVADQSGAVIQNAKVTITNVSTNVNTAAKTDSKGLYLLPGLRPDT
ncbi:MAG TPA: carboxypeptidase-like regulatory domain-containing protein, partial [Terriglobales bacterium]|nr:carboxypeptidase-like regulatory domain-containing protein [Terriglobales bacterium]